MTDPFDDLPNAGSLFDDLPDVESFGNVQGGSSYAPSFGNVQSGSASANQSVPWYKKEITTADVGNSLAEIPGAALTGLEKGSESAGMYGGLALGGLAGLFDDVAGTNLQDSVFENIVKPYDEASQFHEAELAKKGLAGQIAGGVTAAAPDLLLGAMSMGETTALKASTSVAKLLTDTIGSGARMAAPLAEKAAGEAYGHTKAEGGDDWDAYGAALKAAGETEVMGLLGAGATGSIVPRILKSAGAAAGTGEALRELEGREFSGAELGTNLAIGGGFGLIGGHENAPHTPTEVRPGDRIEIKPEETGSPDISPEVFRSPEGEKPPVSEEGISSPAKTESKILSPQAQKEADLAAEQAKAWGFDDVPDAKPAIELPQEHELFADLVPKKVEAPEAELVNNKAESGIGRWEYNLDTQRTERVYERADSQKAMEQSNTPEPLVREFHEGTLTSGKVLEGLASDKSGRVEPETQTLAGYLLRAGKRFGGLDVGITRFNPDNPIHSAEKPETVSGYYHPESNAIRLNKDAPNQHILLHETAHALTHRATIRGARGELGGEAQQAYNAFQGVFHGFKNHLTQRGDIQEVLRESGRKGPNHYGFTNLDEYISEFFSNSKFRELLKTVKLDDVTPKSAGAYGRGKIGTLRNMYEATVRGIRKMLGLPEKAETALDVSFAAAHQFLGNLKPEHLADLNRPAKAAEMAAPVDKAAIDAQAEAAIRAGADPEAVQKRVAELYDKHVGPTSTKNAVRDAERAAEGRDPIIKEAAKTNQETLAGAEKAIAENPDRPAEVVRKLNEDGVHSISTTDEAVLLIEKVRLRNERNKAADTIANANAGEGAKAEARVKWAEAEAKINEMDEATEASGREWGRFGQFRQRMMKEDYSLEAMESRVRARVGGEIKPEEAAQIKKDHEEIKAAEKDLEKTQDDLQSKGEVKVAYEQLVKQMADQLKQAKKKGTFLETLKANADESRAWLKKSLGQLNSGVDPTAFYHLARIGAYHIANGAVKLKDWLVRMRQELGDKTYKNVEDSLPAVHEAATALHNSAGTESKPRMRAKKEMKAEEITHKDIWDLARAHINNGVKGEDAVMKAVHEDVKAHGLSERDVRRLFSEYGKVKFPSKDADKTELRELRALVQMQESIDRLAEGKDALKSGTQRDKPTQAIREKRRTLNDMLKAHERKHGMSPEKLATYQEMRARNVRNQIEDLNKEIATGEKKVRPEAPPDSPEVKALKAERDSLKEELKKLETPEQADAKWQAGRAKSLKNQLEAVYNRIQKGDYGKREKPDRVLNAANAEAAYRLYEAKNLFRRHAFEMEMARRGKVDKVLGALSETQNLSRAVMTGYDLSAFGRQGGWLVASHPILGVKALATSIKAMRSEKAAYAVQREIEHRPNFQLYRKGGLDLTLSSGHVLNKQEEQFMSRWLEKDRLVPGQKIRNTGRIIKNTALAGTRASERAFKVFLNKMRADTFDIMLESLAQNPEKPTKEEIKTIANYVNIGSGRGDMGKFAAAAGAMSKVFFAPRLAMSRVNLLSLKPIRNAQKVSPRVRNLVVKEYIRSMTGLAAVYGMYALYHMMADKDTDTGKLQLDPRAGDFGKMKFGTATVDFSTGLAQWARFFAQAGTGTKVDKNGKVQSMSWDRFSTANDEKEKGPGFGQSDVADLIGKQIRTKLSPAASGVVDFATGKDITGKRATLGSIALQRSIPLPVQTAAQVLQNHGIPESTALILADIVGGSVNEFGDDIKRKEEEKKK